MMVNALDFATMTNAELVQRGVPAGIVTHERERLTGHIRRLQPQWASSIGLWGGVSSLIEIAEHVDVEIEVARAYAKWRRLRWRTRKRWYTQAQLAALCLATPGTARTAAKQLGVLPIELVLYRSAITEVLVQRGIGLPELLSWPAAKLEQTWSCAEFQIEAPRPEPAPIEKPGYLRQMIAQAERWIDAHPGEEP